MESDLLTLIEQDGFRTVRRSTSRGGQYNGSCPFPDCGGTDRFRAQPNHGTYGWFACNQCGRKGSAIDYLILKRGYSKQEALATVGWCSTDGSTPHFTIPTYAYQEQPRWQEPPAQWQEAATDFYRMCQRVLWSPHGAAALAYLRRRGLSDAIIKHAFLGYHPRPERGSSHLWGKAVWLAQGIVIPWFVAKNVWRITIRDETASEGQHRYTQVAGGSNGLYLADFLQRKRPVTVLTEGEFDALSIVQCCRDLVAVVATGTTQGSHTPRWVSLLAQQQRVLVAFDAEETGDRTAMWWVKRLGNAQRLRPCWKDASQMLQDGGDLRAWILSGINTAAPPPRQGVAAVPCSTPQTPTNTEHSAQEERAATYQRLCTARRVSTPAGPGVIFPYTPLPIQIQRGRMGVLLDHAIHPSGRLLEYFFPHDVHLANTSMSEKGN